MLKIKIPINGISWVYPDGFIRFNWIPKNQQCKNGNTEHARCLQTKPARNQTKNQTKHDACETKADNKDFMCPYHLASGGY